MQLRNFRTRGTLRVVGLAQFTKALQVQPTPILCARRVLGFSSHFVGGSLCEVGGMRQPARLMVRAVVHMYLLSVASAQGYGGWS